MKKWLFCMAVLAMGFCFGQEGNTILFSFPRSGLHWACYCVLNLTEDYYVDFPEAYATLKDQSMLEGREKKILRAHTQRYFQESVAPIDRQHDRLILLMRDYKECISREARDNWDDALQLLYGKISPGKAKSIFDNLELYDSWPSDRRLLIYYEDLLSNPKQVLAELVEFLGEDDHLLRPFMKNYEKHQETMLTAYQGKHGTFSQGKDLHYHSKKAPPQVIHDMDEYVKKKYPYLWNKYLMRYEGDGA